VTSIGTSAFYGCTSLTYHAYDNALYLGNKSNPYLVLVKAKNTSIASCTIHEDTRVIYRFAFRDCASLTSVTFVNPNGWTANSTLFSASALTNKATAATYLESTYRGYMWRRE